MAYSGTGLTEIPKDAVVTSGGLLDLRNNKIRSLRGLKDIQGVVYLFMDGNELEELREADLPATLTVASFSGNKIKQLRGGTGSIQHLDLSNNKLTKIYSFSPALKQINLTGNNLTSIPSSNQVKVIGYSPPRISRPVFVREVSGIYNRRRSAARVEDSGEEQEGFDPEDVDVEDFDFFDDYLGALDD